MRVKIFSSRVKVNAGESLGGGDPGRFSQNASDILEVNGISFTAQDGRAYRLCSIDALYAGRLVAECRSDTETHIFAASHTHYAPMLDDTKPHIGSFSRSGYEAYVLALLQAKGKATRPTRCRLYRAEVDVPVYRRFDYPDNIVNRILAAHFGFYPNEGRKIDRHIYLFEFGNQNKADFVIVYHACHPVTQGIGCELSPDYVGAIRQAVRKRFNVETVMFLQGCAGDIRPNLATKRIAWLPRFRLNWKFNWKPTACLIADVNRKYAHAVAAATKYRDIDLGEHPFDVTVRQLALSSGRQVTSFRISLPGEINFDFLPFEVSHIYQLDLANARGAHFIVSCVNETSGYLSHPSQYRAGGYEVEGSLYYMGLREKLVLKELI